MPQNEIREMTRSSSEKSFVTASMKSEAHSAESLSQIYAEII